MFGSISGRLASSKKPAWSMNECASVIQYPAGVKKSLLPTLARHAMQGGIPGEHCGVETPTGHAAVFGTFSSLSVNNRYCGRAWHVRSCQTERSLQVGSRLHLVVLHERFGSTQVFPESCGIAAHGIIGWLCGQGIRE